MTSAIYFWEIIEEESYFNELLPKEWRIEASDIQSPVRRLQVLQTRLFLFENGWLKDLNYDDKGKPALADRFISISHSRHKLALYLHHNKPVGVDLEHIHPRILKVAPRFMNADEKSRFGLEDIHLLTLIWSAKESVFKKHGGATTHFAQSQKIISINQDKNEMLVEISIGSEKITEPIIFGEMNDFVFTYTS